MDNYLIKHAIDNVWCSPSQDNQLIFRLKRVSRPIGVTNFIPFLERRIDLPSKNKIYHIFNIGQIIPSFLGLLNRELDWTVEGWQNFSDAINTSRLFFNIYTASGVSLPIFRCRYMFTRDRTILIAVEEDKRIPINYITDNIYIRLYTNAYFQTTRADSSTEYIFHAYKEVFSNDNALEIQNLYNTYKAKDGYVYSYVNGVLVDNLDLFTIPMNSSVEFIYDSSVIRVVNFTVGDLPRFSSTKDSSFKYLLAYDSKDVNRIEFFDDTDVYIYYESSPGRYKGFYYNKNIRKNHRMVTHTDYSLNVDSVMSIITELNALLSPTPMDVNTFKVQLRIRDAGYQRTLIQDSNRIFELFKLPYTSRIKAMVGVDATVPEWTASNLEDSGYTNLMSLEDEEIVQSTVNDGYGYNSASRIVGKTPVRTQGTVGSYYVDLPYLYTSSATIYEYSDVGDMLGSYHSTGPVYLCTNPNVKYIEPFYGIGTTKPNILFGQTNIPVDPRYSYRVYQSTLVAGVSDENWIDITGSNLYTVTANKLIWNSLIPDDHYLMVRLDSNFLAYDLSIIPLEGRLSFTLYEEQNRDGSYNNYVMKVPMGDIDVFLNGKSLIQGIDFHVKFPLVTIVNKTHLNQPARISEQKIHVRFTGFCNSDLSLDKVEDIGFIEHGVLSNNDIFDIRDDKNLRIIVNGGIRDRDDILFSEDHSGISVINSLNGMPYQIKDTIVPIKIITGIDNHEYRQKSQATDIRISNYLTSRIPQPPRDGLSAIPQLYPIVSSFLSVISYDLANGTLPPDLFQGTPGVTGVFLTDKIPDVKILTIASQYEHLLQSDLCYGTKALDLHYVTYHPHNLITTLSISVGQYYFLQSLNRLFFNGKVDLSPFYTVTHL